MISINAAGSVKLKENESTSGYIPVNYLNIVQFMYISRQQMLLWKYTILYLLFEDH